MFLNNIFHFLKGYVIISVTGENTERFFNICTRRGIRLDNILRTGENTYEAEIKAASFKRIRAAAYKTRTRVHIKKKIYAGSLFKRYKKRVFYAAGLFMCIAFFAVTSRFIWSIDVEGTERCGEIIQAAELAGIKIGAYKPMLPDGNEIKNIILTNTDNFTWAWVYLKGTKAVIEVREAIIPPKLVDRNAPCDIAAAHDGIITDMVVKEGIALCEKGDVVLKGDILIGGTYDTKDGGYRLEHALGEVSAATLHKARKTVKLYKEVRKETGRKKRYIDLKIFSKNIPLYKSVKVDYEDYSIKYERRELRWGKEHYLGAEIVSNTYIEETTERIPITADEAAAGVKDELQEQIAKELLPGSVLKGEEINYEMIDDETAEVCLVMQFIEKIGAEIPIEADRTEEKQE